MADIYRDIDAIPGERWFPKNVKVNVFGMERSLLNATFEKSGVHEGP